MTRPSPREGADGLSPDPVAGTEGAGEPDVSISVSATAKELRFKEKPRSRSRIEVVGDVDDESTTVRENLPDEPQPGKTYRNVRVGRTVAARLRRPKSG